MKEHNDDPAWSSVLGGFVLAAFLIGFGAWLFWPDTNQARCEDAGGQWAYVRGVSGYHCVTTTPFPTPGGRK